MAYVIVLDEKLSNEWKPEPDARMDRAPFYSDSADFAFRLNGANLVYFVRTDLENTWCTEAFQAYDEGSIPFTRSNEIWHFLKSALVHIGSG